MYYIDGYMKKVYPNEVGKTILNYGVLNEYMGKKYTREEIDKIICELVTRHPYIEGAMRITINIMKCIEGNCVEYYHSLDFKNDNYKTQCKGDLDIKYELN